MVFEHHRPTAQNNRDATPDGDPKQAETSNLKQPNGTQHDAITHLLPNEKKPKPALPPIIGEDVWFIGYSCHVDWQRGRDTGPFDRVHGGYLKAVFRQITLSNIFWGRYAQRTFLVDPKHSSFERWVSTHQHKSIRAHFLCFRSGELQTLIHEYNVTFGEPGSAPFGTGTLLSHTVPNLVVEPVDTLTPDFLAFPIKSIAEVSPL